MVMGLMFLLGVFSHLLFEDSVFFHFKMIFLGMVFQSVIGFFILKFSPYFLFLFEFWLIFSVLWGFTKNNEGFSFIWVYLLFTLSVFMIYFILGNELVFSINLLYSFLLIKFGLEGSGFYFFPVNFFLKKDIRKFILVFYTLNSKMIIFLYLIYFNFLSNKNSFFKFIFNYFSLTGIIMTWGILIFFSYITLISEDMEKFMGLSVSISQFLMMFSCFFNLSISLMCFFSDVVLTLFMYYMVFFSVNFPNYFFKGGFSLVFIFIIISHILGIPPFPSFYLEINFLFLMFFSFGFGFKFMFIFFFYLVFLFQFILLFSWLGSSAVSMKFYWDFNFKFYVGYFLTYLFYFEFSFYNLFWFGM